MGQEVAALEVRELVKRFGSVTAVDRLSFAVPRGCVTGFLGPNGAGKTTTMRVLLGLARPSEGASSVLGVPYEKLERPVERVGAALEVTGFHPGRTARNHLRIAALQGRVDAGRVDAVLAATGLGEYADRRVGGSSSGMRQRLALATAMLGEPEVLVLDEPANGLDPAGVAWLRQFLRAFAARGGSVLISSHILAEVAEVADRVVVIDRGALVTEGSVDVITAAGGEAVVVRSPEPGRLRAVLEGAGAVVRDDEEGALLVTGLPIERVGEVAAAEGLVLHELRRRTSSLEDAFLRLTGEPLP